MAAGLSRVALHVYVTMRGAILASFVHAPRRRQLGVGRGLTPLFHTVFFELRTRCNSRCAFCAAAVQSETRRDTTMPFEMYDKVIEQLAGIDYRGQIAYHVNSEPLLTPDLERFVEHARMRLPHAWIRITTNGLGLSRARGEALLRAGVDELTVNRYASDRNAPLPRHLVEFRDETLPRFHEKKRVRAGAGPLRPGDRSIFRFNIHRRSLDEVLSSRAGSAPNKVARPEDATGFCEHPFTQLNITTDGRVGRCCADFNFADVMGNVTTHGLLEIWHGEPLARARRQLLRGDRSKSPLCRQCDFIGVPLERTRPLARLTASFLSRVDRLVRRAHLPTPRTRAATAAADPRLPVPHR